MLKISKKKFKTPKARSQHVSIIRKLRSTSFHLKEAQVALQSISVRSRHRFALEINQTDLFFVA